MYIKFRKPGKFINNDPIPDIYKFLFKNAIEKEANK